MSNNITVNALPVKTWNWLGMNDTRVQIGDTVREKKININIPDEILEEYVAPENNLPDAGDLDSLFSKVGVNRFISKDKNTQKILRAVFDGSDGDYGNLCFEAEDGASIKVLMEIKSSADSTAGLRTEIIAGDNSRVKLVQVFETGADSTGIFDIKGTCGRDGQIEVLQLFLPGGNINSQCIIDLVGEGSACKNNIGYQVLGSSKLDMNYVVNHTGPYSESEMNAEGVLRDHGEKLFRGTIDLRRGAVKAKGNEKEDVLLMDDEVINKTVPIILCTEEDVEGNHGATIGKIDRDLIFYLGTRGVPVEEVYEMMANARIESVIEKIHDDDVEERIREKLGR